MSKLFVNNVGKVAIHDRGEYLPATLRVEMKSPDLPEDFGQYISVFIEKFANTRTTKADIRQNLKRDFIIVPFGEGPGSVDVSGVVFCASQFSGASTNRSKYDRLFEDVQRAGPSHLGGSINLAANEEAKDKKGFAAALTRVQGRIAGAIGVAASGLKAAIGAVSGALSAIKKVADAITAFPSQVVGAIKSALGLGVDSPRVTELHPADLTPLSYQQLHRVFDLLQAGGAQARSKPTIVVSTGGVVFTGRLMSMSSESMENNMGFRFTLSLVILDSPTYMADTPEDNLKTRPDNGFLNQVGGALLQTGISALRPRVPTGVF